LKKFISRRFEEINLFFYYIICGSYNSSPISINSGITFAQEKNKTAEIDDSPFIITSQIDESMETNNNLSQTVNDTS
jgi:hypothetical protein